jgi:hypothetical protein
MLKNPRNEKAALLPASGIGDGLIMTAAAHLFQKKGFAADLYHPKLQELSTWFPDISFSCLCKEYELSRMLQDYGWILVQNDNSSKIKEIQRAREEGIISNLCIFYVTHIEKKHGPLHRLDYVCDLSKTILENIVCAANQCLCTNDFSKETGLKAPTFLQKNRFPRRILLHPSSGSLEKNWPKKKFLLLAQKLKERGFEPVITVSPQERNSWEEPADLGIPLPLFSSLHDFACYLYESKALIGNDSFAGHLSSCFGLPTFILAGQKKQIRLWQPGWKKAHLILPPSWVPNWKGFRLQKHWQHFIGVSRVLETVCKILH